VALSRGHSERRVARLTGLGVKTISSFETSARIGSMKLSQLAKLLRRYGFTEERFFSRKIEELLDPDAIKEGSRERALCLRRGPIDERWS
jgi:transcriptional regulator with XRE-family HTH domain